MHPTLPEFPLAKTPSLYVVATPLGNLHDMGLRALAVLGAVNAIAAEDTRHSQRLLEAFGIKTKLVALHEHNEQVAVGQVIKMLELKRFDIAVLNRTDFIGAMKGKHEYDTLVALTPPVRYFKNYIAFSKVRDDKTLAKRFESAYLAFKKTPRYEELVKKYGIVQ